MGLDSVELVMRIEDTFSIQITDEVATELVTPRKVVDFILTQVMESHAPLPCMSQKAFHLLRSSFIETLPISRKSFRLNASLSELVPEENRNEIWKEIGKKFGAKKWPTVFRPTLLSFLPPRVQNVKDLVEYFVMSEPLTVKGSEKTWTRAQVWDVLKRVIADEIGIKNFTEDSHFIKDMGLG